MKRFFSILFFSTLLLGCDENKTNTSNDEIANGKYIYCPNRNLAPFFVSDYFKGDIHYLMFTYPAEGGVFVVNYTQDSLDHAIQRGYTIVDSIIKK